MTAAAGDDRQAELAANLQLVRDRIAEAAVAAGRDPADVTLVVVTKTFPASDVRLLHELGVRHVGENRHPEAEEKRAELLDLDLRWHFIGQVQSNKAARIASYADVVESVDSRRLVARLGSGAVRHDRLVSCLVQVSLDPDQAPGRGGVQPADVGQLADDLETTPGVRFDGLMAVAPLGEPTDDAFSRLAEIAADSRIAHPGAICLSAGMSDDFPAAIGAGATHVRVGSAVLGHRPPLR